MRFSRVTVVLLLCGASCLHAQFSGYTPQTLDQLLSYAAGMGREEPIPEVSETIGKHGQLKLLSPEMEAALHALDAPPSEGIARLLERAKADGDQARLHSINQMTAGERGKRAAPLFEEALRKGSAGAALMLAALYFPDPNVWGIADASKAFKYATVAASDQRDTGYSGPACALLGDLYLLGDGVPQSEEKARDWYERGLQLGDPACLHTLVVFYMAGGVRLAPYGSTNTRLFPANYRGTPITFLGQSIPRLRNLPRAYALQRALMLATGQETAGEKTFLHCLASAMTLDEQVNAEKEAENVRDTFNKSREHHPHISGKPSSIPTIPPANETAESVPKEKTPSAPTRADLPTKAEWKAKMARNFRWYPGTPVMGSADQFQKIMGKPDRTQTVGDQAYWYYQCSDGTIQLVMNILNIQAAGFIQADVNDY